MQSRRDLILLLGLALLFTLACSAVRLPWDATPTPVPAATPVPTPRSEATASTPAGGFQVTVENQTPYEACYVLISPSDSEDWGEDWLSLDEVIAPGDSRTFDVPGGPHDVRVEDCDYAALGTAWELEENTTVTLGGEGLVTLRLVNESYALLCYVFISPTDAEEWGADAMGTWETIEPEVGERLFFVPPDTYDLAAVDCDDQEIAVETDVEVYQDYVWTVEGRTPPTAVSGEGFTVTVVNETPEDLCFVFIAPTDYSSWGGDWLEEDEVLEPGDRRSFDVPSGLYDVSVADCEEAVVATAWEVSDDVTLRPGATGDVAVRVINMTEADACYVYLAPASREDWGEDWLNDLEILGSGGARVFYVPPDTYDLLVQDCAGDNLATGYDVEIKETFEWVLEE